MFKGLQNRDFYCDYCRKGFTEDDPEKGTGWGLFHGGCEVEGVKQAQEEYLQAEKDYQESVKLQIKKDEKLLRKLRKRLPTKIMKEIDKEIHEHGHYEMGYKVVSQDQCKGERMKGRDYFCDSTVIRTVYNDVSSGGYPCDDGYAGDIYIYIGNGQYFNMWVYG